MNSRWGKTVLAVLFSLVIGCSPCLWASAALFAFETQFEHESADIAWLTDLVFKEDLSSVDGIAQSCKLVAKPETPYTETSDSFAEEVGYYCSLYNLNHGAQRSAYIYFFDVLGTQSGGLVAGEISDDDIRVYLESVCIEYPEDPDSDELILARALYAAMASGAFSGVTSGASLEEVAVEYLANLTGVNIETLREWLPEDSVLSLDAYILAASRLALWTNGYDVDENTDEEDVFRMVAVMTIEKLGISADSTLSFEQLKYKFMAAMLGKKYGVSIDADRLAQALADGDAAYYVLQLLGRDYGVSVRPDNSDYEQAFDLVAGNTGVFDVEEDEFYADIYYYELTLNYKRSSIWIYPTAYMSNDSAYDVSVDVNGVGVRNGYYTEIRVDPDKPTQTLAVRVSVTSAKQSSECVYYIDLHQGENEKPAGQSGLPSDNVNANPFISSESLVSQIMASFGLDTSVVSYMGSALYSFALPTQSVMTYISPSFDADTLFADDGQAITAEPVAVLSDEEYIAVLDQIGSLADVDIKGIDGTEILDQANGFSPADYITF